MIYLRLFFEFARAGLFAVGGGLATLPFLYEISDKTGWFTHAQLTDMLAISESTPGPIGVNTATYVGFTTAGFPGALCATLGLVFPSIVVIILVAKVLDAFRDNKVISGVFYGLRPASAAMIAAAGISVVQISLLNLSGFASGGILELIRVPNLLLAIVLFVLIWRFHKHPAFYIGIAAVAGIVFQME